jgi:hypothetical protein
MLTMHDLNDFIQTNKEIINNLSKSQRAAFEATHKDIEGNITNREKLEKHLQTSSLPITDINSTYRSLEFLEGKITEGFYKLKTILGRDKEQPVISDAMKIAASISRQGVVNIRPVKGRPYSTPKPIRP